MKLSLQISIAIVIIIINLDDNLAVLRHGEWGAVSYKDWLVARAERQVGVEVTLHQDYLVITIIMTLLQRVFSVKFITF